MFAIIALTFLCICIAKVQDLDLNFHLNKFLPIYGTFSSNKQNLSHTFMRIWATVIQIAESCLEIGFDI